MADAPPSRSDAPSLGVSLAPSGRGQWLLSAALFVVAVPVAWHRGWTPADVFWSFWITSILAGGALMVAILGVGVFEAVRYLRADASGPSDWAWGFGLIGFIFGAFFLVFVVAHVMTATFFAAMVERVGPFSVDGALLADKARTYWPILLSGFLLRAPDFRTALAPPGPGEDPVHGRGERLFPALIKAFVTMVPLWLASFVVIFGDAFHRALEIGRPEWLFFLAYGAFYFLPAHPIKTEA